MTIHSNDFYERLARIEAGGTNTRHTLFVGSDETYLLPRKEVAQASKTEVLTNAAYPLTMLVALILGMMAVFAVKLLRFHLAGNVAIGTEPLNDLALESALALILCVAVGRWIWHDAGRMRSWQAMGVLFMAVGWHNIVHLVPNLFRLLFSEIWTAHVLATTEFSSLIIRGYTIPF